MFSRRGATFSIPTPSFSVASECSNLFRDVADTFQSHLEVKFQRWKLKLKRQQQMECGGSSETMHFCVLIITIKDLYSLFFTRNAFFCLIDWQPIGKTWRLTSLWLWHFILKVSQQKCTHLPSAVNLNSTGTSVGVTVSGGVTGLEWVVFNIYKSKMGPKHNLSGRRLLSSSI